MRSFSRRSFLLALTLVALAGGCSAGDGSKGTSSRPGTGPATTHTNSYAFSITGATVRAMAPQAPAFPPDVSAAVKTTLDTWLGIAVVGPLQAGKPPAGLDAVFTEPALGRISTAGTERSAMIEEVGPLKGKVQQDRADANLTAVTAPGGEVALVTAQIDLRDAVRSGDGYVDVVRGGELVLVPDRGTWRIDAFDVVVHRDTRAR